MTAIPMLDLAREAESLRSEIREAIERVLDSAQFILGPEVDALERAISARLGVTFAVGVNSGTDALVIALRSVGVQPAGEVITTSFSFVASASAILHASAQPVFVDIDPATFNMDVDKVRAAITSRTQAILAVHIFGQPCELDPLLSLAEEYGIPVIEDVAQAFGTRYKGKPLGSIGRAAALSFFPSKNLGAYGDAGMVVTNDPEVARLARMLRSHGSERKYHNEILGYNSRLDAMQAAILNVKLRHFDRDLRQRAEAAAHYNALLSDVSGLAVPYAKDREEHSFHQYTVRIANGRRAEVQDQLSSYGIQSAVYYPIPLPRLPLFHDKSPFPCAEEASEQVLSLPIGPLLTVDERLRVAAVVRSALE